MKKTPRENIELLRRRLKEGVTLVAVSKTYPAEDVMNAYEGGQRIFGENRPQEMTSKYAELPKDISWHMIGNLQTNKVKMIAPYVAMIHSVSSERLLQEIDKEAAKCGRTIDVLLEVYIATEESKHGWNGGELNDYLASGAWRSLTNVRICGVMGMATFTDDEHQVRGEFRALKQLFDNIKKDYFADNEAFSQVSMGMSGDWQLAVEEGSTMVRIGSSIFGNRNY